MSKTFVYLVYFGVYSLAILFIGKSSFGESDSISKFFVGERKIGLCRLFFTFVGTWISAATILGWGLYGARCIEFLFSERITKYFMAAYALVAILGATANLGLMWSIAETFNGLMAIPNLIALFLLSGKVVELTKEYFSGEGKTR